MDGLHWTIESSPEQLNVQLVGSVTEDADLQALIPELQQQARVQIDLAKVARINSCGVREWVNAFRALPPTVSVELVRCSPVIVAQINMISNFIGSATVSSVQAPFACPDCAHELTVVVPIEQGAMPTLQPVACPQCGSAMEFDDLEDSYFAFVF